MDELSTNEDIFIHPFLICLPFTALACFTALAGLDGFLCHVPDPRLKEFNLD